MESKLVKKQIQFIIEDLQTLSFETARLTDFNTGSDWSNRYELIVKQVENIAKLVK